MTVVSESERPVDLAAVGAAIDRFVDPARAACHWVHREALADLLRPGGPAAYRRGPWLVEWDGRTPAARRIGGRFVDLGTAAT